MDDYKVGDTLSKYINHDEHGWVHKSRIFPVKWKLRNDWDYSQTRNFLTKEECDSIISWGEEQELSFATIYADVDSKKPSTDIRCVQSAALPDNDFAWLYEKLANEIILINDMCYGFDIHGLYENIVFLKYRDFSDILGPEASIGKYDWHRDISGSYLIARKISSIIQLNSGEEYKGCEFQMQGYTGPITCDEKDAGTLITFASNRLHRITPIEAGTRYSLVCWVTGPPFK